MHACTRPRHLSTLDNPHPGQAQTAVFQNTAEGNYKLGQALDHEAGGILQCILSPRFSRAKTGLDQVNNDSQLPCCDKNTSRRPALSPQGTVVLGERLTGELGPDVSGRGGGAGTTVQYLKTDFKSITSSSCFITALSCLSSLSTQETAASASPTYRKTSHMLMMIIKLQTCISSPDRMYPHV